MSAAGVEALTVCAAEALFHNLKLGRIGESRVQEAVGRLRAFSTASSVLYLGFGLKHIIRKLAESSEGLCCIAICASLPECYSTLDSAKILRECFISCNAPANLTPSLRQWTNLVEACEGALASTSFPVLVHNITRLCLPEGRSGLRCRSEPESVAKALQGIMQVSKGTLENVQITGGADCGWVAAFAHWLLDLSIEIRDSSGAVLFQPGTVKAASKHDPQVIVIYDIAALSRLQLTGRSFIIPSGQQLVRGTSYRAGGDVLSYGRVPWLSVLQDTFGNRAKALFDQGLTGSCGIALGCAARIFYAYVEDSSDIPPDHAHGWSYVNSSSCGRGFITTIHHWLPELANSKGLMSALEENLSSSYVDAVSGYQRAIHLIATSCSCLMCRHSETDSLVSPFQPDHPFCQTILVEVICDLVQILSAIEMPIKLFPTRCGIESLYWNRVNFNKRKATFDYVYRGLLKNRRSMILARAMHLFSGESRTIPSSDESVLTSNGICYYLDILVNITISREKCNLVHIVPGRIEWENVLFEEVYDLPKEDHKLGGPHWNALPDKVESLAKLCKIEESASDDIHCDLFLQDSNHRSHTKSIMAGYRISTSKGRFMLGPRAISDQLAKSLVGPDCKGRRCGRGGPPAEALLVRGEGLMINSDDNYHRSIPIMRLLARSVPAQCLAICNPSIYARNHCEDTQAFGVGEYTDFILQSTQCLECLFDQAIRRADISEKSGYNPTRAVCIPTWI